MSIYNIIEEIKDELRQIGMNAKDSDIQLLATMIADRNDTIRRLNAIHTKERTAKPGEKAQLEKEIQEKTRELINRRDELYGITA